MTVDVARAQRRFEALPGVPATSGNAVRSLRNGGSSNLNRRSLDHDEEVTAIIFGGATPGALANDFADDVARSERLTRSRWRSRPLHQRLGEVAVAPLRRYL